jgi:hypothetical protein
MTGDLPQTTPKEGLAAILSPGNNTYFSGFEMLLDEPCKNQGLWLMAFPKKEVGTRINIFL